MKKDIVQIANVDPVVAGLLEFRHLFFWADWQIIRKNRAPELIDKMLTRVKASFKLPWLILILQMPVLLRPSRFGPPEATFWDVWGYSLSVGSLLVLGATVFHFATRKKLRMQIRKLYRLKLMAQERSKPPASPAPDRITSLDVRYLG